MACARNAHYRSFLRGVFEPAYVPVVYHTEYGVVARRLSIALQPSTQTGAAHKHTHTMDHTTNNNTTAVSVPALLKKTEHYDKDERYMATSDLCELLKRQAENNSNTTTNAPTSTPTMDATQERQICTAVLRLLHDKSNDVQAVAVKCLGVLLTTVQQEQVLEIADSLADQVLDASKSELRDVYAIGLRTLCRTVPSAMGDRVSQRLTSRLLEGVRSEAAEREEIVLCSLDILTDVLVRFGAACPAVTRQHEAMLQLLMQCLSRSLPVRKRAGTVIGCLSAVLSDALLQRAVQALLSQIDRAAGVGKEGRRKTVAAHAGAVEQPGVAVGDTRALIRTMCTVSGTVGHRLGQELIDRIIPIFLRFTDPQDAVSGDDEDDDSDEEMEDVAKDETAVALANELRESCFMGFESFVARCPKQVEPHLTSIIQAALAYMAYDPNYSYGVADDADDNMGGVAGDDEEEIEEEGDYEEDEDEEEDDDDESWKVRRSAIRALRAVVKAKKHDPIALWTAQYSIRKGKSDVVATAILGRFKEREENCRVEIIDCFTELVVALMAAEVSGAIRFASADSMDTSSGSVDFKGFYPPKVVKATEKILKIKKGNERSKSSALELLSTLSDTPGGIGNEEAIGSVLKHIQVLLSVNIDPALHREGTSKALRLDALKLLHAILASSCLDVARLRPSVRDTVLPLLCQSVKEQWYKMIAEALYALSEIPRIFVSGYPEGFEAVKMQMERTQVATMMFDAIDPLLAAHDVDQEIKEGALKACASILSCLSSSLTSAQTRRLLLLLLERLKNETTRITAIKTLSIIAESSGIDLSPILADSITSMASFLNQQSRSLKQNSLDALVVVVTNHGSYEGFVDGKLYSSVVQELTQLIVANDLHLTHLSL
jgi:cullin-associated NEDD8-dissociated protein 1